MKRGLKTFARAVQDGNTDGAEEMLEKIVQGNMKDRVWKGYHKALKGIIEGLNSDNDLTLPKQIADDNFSLEKLEKLRIEMDERSSQKFRPENEHGYSAAWSDVLQVIIEDAKEE
ncbi:hypothetical protein AKJ57_00570 [candidate division MSBL1 archaeon SCGC-AAA259A05]|uniref:Uncharacterized protein n=1 Tax=candidate division MSBL1 archaeon SCGC-AAA259A05 TaxID=1698259 RepID=A0A133UBN5_9EURY|nr:hypothetical protein AKJ57_00570 [candidate division MSBL1 archaeon SCGC-AAA259A05]